MASFVAFLRAVNVGGRQVKMAALREQLEANGFTAVSTYIASGNVRLTHSVRSAAQAEQEIEKVLAGWLGFDVPTMVRTPRQLTQVYDVGHSLTSPLPGSPRHYVSFLRDKPAASSVAQLEEWDQPDERAQVVGREVHLWLGSERPKLTNARMEKILGTVGTARDWKTVAKLAETWT